MEEIINEINKEAWTISKQVIGWPVKPIKRRSDKKSYIQLILSNYDNVTLILERIKSDQNKLSGLHKSHMALEAREADVSINDIIKHNNLIALDIESLYVWSAKIYDLFKKYGVVIDLKELERIALIRHKFLTHMTGSELFKKSKSTRSGIRYNPFGANNVEILFHPDNISDRDVVKLKNLVKKSLKFIPELGNERNYFKQLHILWRNKDKIVDGKLRNLAISIVEKLGVATDPPEHIGGVLLGCLKEFRKTKYKRK